MKTPKANNNAASNENIGEIQHGIAWNDSLNLGYEQIDEQHRALFELVSDLVESCIIGRNTEKLHETMEFLVNYTVKHFHDEETLQMQFDYPDYTRHKQLHEDFKLKVGELVQRFDENDSPEELSKEVNRVIVRWLISHIQLEDKKIGAHIRKVTSRQEIN